MFISRKVQFSTTQDMNKSNFLDKHPQWHRSVTRGEIVARRASLVYVII